MFLLGLTLITFIAFQISPKLGKILLQFFFISGLIIVGIIIFALISDM